MACSRFRPDSELWRVNHAHGHPVGISPLLTQALATALTAARITDGDVDPTCGQSLARLGYDRDFAQTQQDTTDLATPPAPAAGWQTVELDTERRTVRVPDAVMLDLGATAKALAADRAATRIHTAVGCGVLVNLGGDIRVAGEPPAGGWRVGILDDLAYAAPPCPRRAQPGGHHPRWRPRHLQHPRPGLAAGRDPAAPHHRAGHRPARGLLLAYRQRGRRHLRRREHGEHGGDPARRAGSRNGWMSCAYRPASCVMTARRSSSAAGPPTRPGQETRHERFHPRACPVVRHQGDRPGDAAPADRHRAAGDPHHRPVRQRQLAAFSHRGPAPQPLPAGPSCSWRCTSARPWSTSSCPSR